MLINITSSSGETQKYNLNLNLENHILKQLKDWQISVAFFLSTESDSSLCILSRQVLRSPSLCWCSS